MALFGAPIAHEDHAHRACYAALHLARDAEGLRRRAARRARAQLLGADGHQLGRGGGRQDRRRPAHGLHRAGTHGRSRAADGGARRVRQGDAGGEHDRHRARLLRVARPRCDEDQGRRRAGARRRTRGRRPDAHAARPFARARAVEVRRSRRRDGAARNGAAPQPRRRRPGNRRDGRGRLREVAAVLRVPRAVSRARHHRAHRRPAYRTAARCRCSRSSSSTARSSASRRRQRRAGAPEDRRAPIAQAAPEELESLPLLYDFMRVPDPAQPAPERRARRAAARADRDCCAASPRRAAGASPPCWSSRTCTGSIPTARRSSRASSMPRSARARWCC